MTTETPTTAQQPSLETVQIELEPSLTEEQKKILSFIYDSAKGSASDILNNVSSSQGMKVTLLVGSIIKMMETLTFNQAKVSGANKKAVALELGRTLIKDLIKDESAKSDIMSVYNFAADQTLELLIDVSRNVNVKAIAEATVSCCGWLTDLIKRK